MTALYRKYRPRTFDEVIGQDHVTQPLIQALKNGRLNHAYLFSGPRGCGKTSSARILARSLNCEQGPTPDPCGTCRSCTDLAPGGPGSIDVIEIDAASHGGVDDARELREKAFFAPVSSRFKVYVIDEAHMVSSAGFNALLKLVEEPPDYIRFVFATTEPEKVLGTIKSRTHHYPFRLIPPSILRPYCEQLAAAEGVAVEPAVFPLVVKAGGGSARDSLSILDQLIAGSDEHGVTYQRAVALLGVTDAALINETCDALANSDGAALFAAIDRVVEAGHEPRRFATDLLERLRDLIVLHQVPDAIAKGLLDVPADEIERMTGHALRLGPAELSRLAELVHDGLATMRGTTAPRLTLELICARMLLPGAEATPAAFMQRLERLEVRAATAPPAAMPVAGAQVLAGGGGQQSPVAGAPISATGPSPAGGAVAGVGQHVVAETGAAQVGGVPQAGGGQPVGAPSGGAVPGGPQSSGGSGVAGADQAAVAGPPQPAAAQAAPQPVAPQPAVPQPAVSQPVAPPPVAQPVVAQAAPQAGGFEAAPAGGAIDIGMVHRAWDEIISQIRSNSPRAAALVRDVTVRELDGDSLVLLCQNRFHAEAVTKASDLLQEAIKQVLNVRWQIRVELGGGGGGGGARPPAPPKQPAPAPQPRPASAAPSGPVGSFGTAASGSVATGSGPIGSGPGGPASAAGSGGSPAGSAEAAWPVTAAVPGSADGSSGDQAGGVTGQSGAAGQAGGSGGQPGAAGHSGGAGATASGGSTSGGVGAGNDGHGAGNSASQGGSAPGGSQPGAGSVAGGFQQAAPAGAATGSPAPGGATGGAAPGRSGGPTADGSAADTGWDEEWPDLPPPIDDEPLPPDPGWSAARPAARPSGAGQPGSPAANGAPVSAGSAGSPAVPGFAASPSATASGVNGFPSATASGVNGSPAGSPQPGHPTGAANGSAPGATGPASTVAYEGFEPGDEPGDQVIDSATARQSTEEHALRLLSEILGGEKIS